MPANHLSDLEGLQRPPPSALPTYLGAASHLAHQPGRLPRCSILAHPPCPATWRSHPSCSSSWAPSSFPPTWAPFALLTYLGANNFAHLAERHPPYTPTWVASALPTYLGAATLLLIYLGIIHLDLIGWRHHPPCPPACAPSTSTTYLDVIHITHIPPTFLAAIRLAHQQAPRLREWRWKAPK